MRNPFAPSSLRLSRRNIARCLWLGSLCCAASLLVVACSNRPAQPATERTAVSPPAPPMPPTSAPVEAEIVPAATPPAVAATQPAATAPADYECRWAHGPVEIDGNPTEDAWKAAAEVSDFTLPWLGAGARPAKTATKAKLLWDREHLYFFAEMQDSDLYADVTKQDGEVWNNDAFELFFKPAADKPGYYEFEVSPANTVLDMFLPSRNSGGYPRYKADGEFDMKTAVQLRGTLNKWADGDQGWSVEGRIPWKSFIRTGGRPQPDERWTYALCRVDFSMDFEGPELSTNAPLKIKPFPDFHNYEGYAPVRFVGPQQTAAVVGEAHAGLVKPYGIDTLVPLTTSRVAGSPEPPHPYRLVQAYPKLQIKYPIFVTGIPGSDQLLIVAQDYGWGPTQLYQMPDDESVEKPTKVMDFPAAAYGITFHPDFKNNGYCYIGQNEPLNAEGAKTKIVRYHVDPKPPFTFDTKSATVIIEWESNGHNGGAVAFGPDGMMYVTSGDGTSDSDTWLSGQDLTRPLSKLLRIDVDHPDPGKMYSVPKDNPFAGRKGVFPGTYAYGFRNPWRLWIDQPTGQIWVGQNGQDNWEQIYLVEPGANYGWSVMEGGHPFYLDRKRGPDPISPPTAEHPHSVARSLTGGKVYREKALPQLHGAYLYGDFSTGKVWAIRVDEKTRKVTYHEEIADSPAQITSFGTDSKGEMLITDHGGHRLMRLEPTPKDLPRPKFPTTLSETGLFASVKGHVMVPGMIPYDVNNRQWADGAFSQRYLGIPHQAGKDNRIDFTTNRGWTFPEGTVIVQSFGLEIVAGYPNTRRWIETRLMLKQENEWIGYSYAWRGDQTDATLVDGGGRDVEFVTIDRSASERVRKQRWRYPSRTECMSCHSRAANYTLGMQTLQMNRDYDYGDGRVDNQLRTLEHLGLFRVNWASEAHAAIRDDAEKKGMTKQERDAHAAEVTATRNQREATPSPLLYQSPERYEKLVDAYAATGADLNARAKSYLHANCAHCHVEAGGGNSRMELEFTTGLPDMRVLGERPVHGDFNLTDGRIVAPGAPQRSVMLHRVAQRGAGQMPPLGTTVRDEAGVKLLRDWITQVKAPEPPTETPKDAAAQSKADQ